MKRPRAEKASMPRRPVSPVTRRTTAASTTKAGAWSALYQPGRPTCRPKTKPRVE